MSGGRVSVSGTETISGADCVGDCWSEVTTGHCLSVGMFLDYQIVAVSGVGVQDSVVRAIS